MSKSHECYTVESLIDMVERRIGDRFEVTGEGKKMVLTLPAQPWKEFGPNGRKQIVPYLQGMIWASKKLRAKKGRF